MNWEAVTAIGTVFTGLVIFFTVIIGQRQIKVTLDQLRQLRRASQLDAANVIFAELASPAFLDARRFILNELPECLKDPKFHKELELVGRADENVHKELIVLRTFERIALYVEEELLDANLIRHLASGRIVDTWEGLAEVVAVHRRSFGVNTWQHFEGLYHDTISHATEQGWTMARADQVVRELRAPRDDAASRS
ncbi:MAG TPA: hypothetical protein VIX35_02465 [Vicinamibacterales bacterium]